MPLVLCSAPTLPGAKTPSRAGRDVDGLYVAGVAGVKTARRSGCPAAPNTWFFVHTPFITVAGEPKFDHLLAPSPSSFHWTWTVPLIPVPVAPKPVVFTVPLTVRRAPMTFCECVPRMDRAPAPVTVVMAVAVARMHWGLGVAAGFVGSRSYSDIATHLVADGHYSRDGVHPTAYRPPGYPLLLAGLMVVFGDAWLVAAVVAQALLAVGCGVLVFLLADRVFADRVAGVVGVGLLASDLLFIEEALARRETVLFTFVLLVFLLAVFQMRYGLAAGLVVAGAAGAGYLTRPTGVVLVAMWAVWLIVGCWPVRSWRSLGWAAVSIGLLAAMVGAWQGRVVRALGTWRFAPASTAGVNLYQGNNPDTLDYYPAVDVDRYNGWIERRLAAAGIARHDEVARDRHLRQAAWAYIGRHPGRFVRAAGTKIAALLSPVPTPYGRGRLDRRDGRIVVVDYRTPARHRALAVIVPHGIVLLAGAAACGWAAWRGWLSCPRGAAVLGALVVMVLALHAVTFGETRFRLPLDPILIVLTSVGVCACVRRRAVGR